MLKCNKSLTISLIILGTMNFSNIKTEDSIYSKTVCRLNFPIPISLWKHNNFNRVHSNYLTQLMFNNLNSLFWSITVCIMFPWINRLLIQFCAIQAIAFSLIWFQMSSKYYWSWIFEQFRNALDKKELIIINISV